MKVLVVDDNIDNLEMIEIILKSNNYIVNKAINGKVGLEMLRSEKYDLIISDILMPVMDGFQFCKECKQDKELQKIIFIFYTATYIDQKDEEFALALGAQKFIRKPQEPELFLSLIKEVVDKYEILPANPIIKEENELLKLYSERLICKLEKRNLDLESEISAHKETVKELLKSKEKAEESNRLKTSFLANISHEIRTPMNGIMGFAELLKNQDLTGDKQKEYIGIIQKSGIRMLNIINDIINVSKIESGQIDVNIQATNINMQIEDLYVFFKPEIEQKGIKVLFKNSLTANESIIQTDREKFWAILTNLIKNAIKFTSEGTIEFGYTKNDTYLQFYVKDSGVGIPMELKEIIFERFRQGSEDISRGYEGTGLGLSISKAYVEMLGGKIWFVNNSEVLPGERGSTFSFTIPYNVVTKERNEVKKDAPAKIEVKHINNLNVLIAEDDEVSQELITIMTEKFCKKVLIAKNGIEAVNTCKKNPDIDLILMDIKMPELNGYEATRRIRKFNKDVIIFAQTAYAFMGDKEKTFKAGCNDFISKPIKNDELMFLLSKYFKDKR